MLNNGLVVDRAKQNKKEAMTSERSQTVAWEKRKGGSGLKMLISSGSAYLRLAWAKRESFRIV